MTKLTIGQLAKQTDISNDTIRLYERYGLLDKPARAENGYRQYSAATVTRLKFIRRAKAMGFTLKEIQELLAIQSASRQACQDTKQQVEMKLQVIRAKIQELTQLELALSRLMEDCQAQDPCPILTALADATNEPA